MAYSRTRCIEVRTVLASSRATFGTNFFHSMENRRLTDGSAAAPPDFATVRTTFSGILRGQHGCTHLLIRVDPAPSQLFPLQARVFLACRACIFIFQPSGGCILQPTFHVFRASLQCNAQLLLQRVSSKGIDEVADQTGAVQDSQQDCSRVIETASKPRRSATVAGDGRCLFAFGRVSIWIVEQASAGFRAG